MKNRLLVFCLLFSIEACGFCSLQFSDHFDREFGIPDFTADNIDGKRFESNIHLTQPEKWMLTPMFLLSSLNDQLELSRSQKDYKKIIALYKAIEDIRSPDHGYWIKYGATRLRAELRDMSDDESIAISTNPEAETSDYKIIDQSILFSFKELGNETESLLFRFAIDNGFYLKGEFYFVVRKEEYQSEPKIALIFNLKDAYPFLTTKLLELANNLKPCLEKRKKYFYIFKCDMR